MCVKRNSFTVLCIIVYFLKEIKPYLLHVCPYGLTRHMDHELLATTAGYVRDAFVIAPLD